MQPSPPSLPSASSPSSPSSASPAPFDVLALAATYELGRPLGVPTPAARGQQGIVWRLDTEQGAFAVKVLLVPMAEADATAQAAHVAELARRGVHTPLTRRTREGAVLTMIGSQLVRVYTWVDLHQLDRGLDPAAIGHLLAMLHRDPLPAEPPVHPWYTEPVPAPVWAELADRLARAQAPFAAEFAASVPHFLDLQNLFATPGPVQWCHRDLWADNVRGTPSGRLCVIDWDNAGSADPVQETACALVEFGRGQAERAHAVAVAYREHGGRALPSEPGDLTMALAQFGHFAAAAARRWLAADDGDDDTRSRAAAWFREGYDEPLDRAGIADLLEAVRSVP